ncbi:hypothetical protein CR513_59869, partial [Mucuna pruriens]
MEAETDSGFGLGERGKPRLTRLPSVANYVVADLAHSFTVISEDLALLKAMGPLFSQNYFLGQTDLGSYTLPSPYYDKVVGNVASNFVYLVVVGERVELAIRCGNNVGFAKNHALEKKKGEANAVLVEPVFPQGKGNAPSYPTQMHTGSRSATIYTNPPPVPYVPPHLPRADTGVATSSRLAQQGTRRPPRTVASPSAVIEAGGSNPFQAPGTSISEELQPQRQGLNIQNNPLPTHRGVAINAISNENKDEAEGTNIREKEEGVVRYITNSARRVEERTHLSRLNKAESTSVAYNKGNDNPLPKPLIIHYNLAFQPIMSFIIQVLARLVYNNNAVPWRYPAGETTTPPAIKENPIPEVTNISGTRGETKSKRIFAPEGLRNRPITCKEG